MPLHLFNYWRETQFPWQRAISGNTVHESPPYGFWDPSRTKFRSGRNSKINTGFQTSFIALNMTLINASILIISFYWSVPQLACPCFYRPKVSWYTGARLSFTSHNIKKIVDAIFLGDISVYARTYSHHGFISRNVLICATDASFV